jgi:phosphoserine phosphatase RsbU/P
MTVLDDPARTESARVRALAATGLLDAPPPPQSDRVALLARELFDVPVARLTLVGRDVQRFLPTRDEPALEVPRRESLCDGVVRTGAPLVVPDLAADPRFAGHPHVAGGQRMRFYAGAPLHGPDDAVIGTLCLLDQRPRRFAPGERSALVELAGWAEAELTRSAELDRAAEVQRGLLPAPGGVDLPGYRVAAACVPARAVGGDLVDRYLAPDGDLVLSLGDVMGKGTGAAIMMAAVRAALRTAGRRHAPAEAVRRAAAALEQDLQRTGTLVTLWHARVDPGTGATAVVDAGHGLHLVVRDGAVVAGDRPSGLPLGVVPGDSWPPATTRLHPGDALVAFSDGLVDLWGGVEEAFEQLRRLVAAHPDPSVAVRRVEALARRHPLPDDVTVQVLRRL